MPWYVWAIIVSLVAAFILQSRAILIAWQERGAGTALALIAGAAVVPGIIITALFWFFLA